VNILFLTSGHNGLSQRLLIELTDRGHQVVVTLATSDDAMLKSVDQNEPDLIVAPMLKVAIPEAIYSKHTCLIVHPGIKGDRGSSSLDWNNFTMICPRHSQRSYGAIAFRYRNGLRGADASWQRVGPILGAIEAHSLVMRI
jgi:hypothetical protein